MFLMGCMFLIVGGMWVYKTRYMIKLFINKPIHRPVMVKLMGLGIAVIGILMIIYGDFPKSLGFMRIF